MSVTIAVVVFFVFILVVVPIVVLVFVFFIFPIVIIFFFVIVGFIRPTLRFVGDLEVHLMPHVEVELFDLAVEVFNLHEFAVLVDGQHAKRFFVF